MNGRERILAALNHQEVDRAPTFEWFIDPRVGEELCGSGDIFDIVEKLDIDGINIRADYDKVAIDEKNFSDEWGRVHQDTGDVLPAVMKVPIGDVEDHLDYVFPNPDSPTRFLTVEKALAKWGDNKGIILNLRDGFSDMRDLLGYEEALMALLAEPDDFKDLLNRVVDYNVELATVAKKRYGLEVIATTDDIATASSLIMSPEVYFDVIAEPFKRLVTSYKELGYKHIKHCDGNIEDVIDYWIECGIDCIDPVDPDAGYSIGEFKERFGDKIALKGNIDCKGALCSGTPEEVRKEVRKCLDSCSNGLILSSSNTIHCGVKPENYKAMLEELCY